MASRAAVIAVSFICVVLAGYFTAIDWLLDTGRPEDVRTAARWMPWNAEVWRLMPQVEPERAAEHWRHVLRLAPRDLEARLALASDAELRGQWREAEALLLEASRLHKGYLPAWTLANFYLRRNDEEQFWRWARRAATFEVDLTALFQLGLRLRPDPAALLDEFAVHRGPALRQLLTAAAQLDLLERALPVAERVAAFHTPEARDQLLWDTDYLLKKRAGREALAYWNLVQGVSAEGLVNGDFQRASLERGFDWRRGSAEVTLTTRGGLRAGLYGKQEDAAVLAAQTVVLRPGAAYELRYRYRNALPKDAHPVRWQVGAERSEPLATGDWREATWRFRAAAELSELQLVSRREPGTHRGVGEVELAWVKLRGN